jgi:hypothetical protein
MNSRRSLPACATLPSLKYRSDHGQMGHCALRQVDRTILWTADLHRLEKSLHPSGMCARYLNPSRRSPPMSRFLTNYICLDDAQMLAMLPAFATPADSSWAKAQT